MSFGGTTLLSLPPAQLLLLLFQLESEACLVSSGALVFMMIILVLVLVAGMLVLIAGVTVLVVVVLVGNAAPTVMVCRAIMRNAKSATEIKGANIMNLQ